FTAAWFDLGNRLTTTADYGNNGDLPFTRPPTPPAPNSSSDVLVTLIEYDGAGRSYWSTNNLGKVSQIIFDVLGRSVREVGNFIDGMVGETELDIDWIMDIVYDSSGWVTQR